ncbi:hypothetical protein HK105_207711 [Polyrhizophydium stewartii]|uniref:Ankyrin repeat protein n=1 Tax=Polyrhizophydium stewartii TaxID=2732419 RepID=A0ABR4N009_9FUNG
MQRPALDTQPDHDAALPPGRSHWDRLPRELRDAVRMRADDSLFTRITSGRFPVAPSLSVRERRILWEVAFDLDWDGDLRRLPHFLFDFYTQHIRSRRMAARLVDAGLASWEDVAPCLAKNAWDDLLVDTLKPLTAATFAAAYGRPALLRRLLDAGCATNDTFGRLVYPIARAGDADAINLLLDMFPDAIRHGDMPVVVWSGDIDLVQQMLDRGMPPSHLRGYSYAAYRSLPVFQLLVRLGQITAPDHRHALYWGSPEVLAFIERRWPGTLRSGSFYIAYRGNGLPTIRFLHSIGLTCDKFRLLTGYFTKEDLAAVSWICDTFDVTVTKRLLSRVCSYGSIDLFLLLHKRSKIPIKTSFVGVAIDNGHTTLAKFLLRRHRPAARLAASRAASLGDIELLSWLDDWFPWGITWRTLRAAIRHRRISIVEFLLKLDVSAAWPSAMAVALSLPASDERQQLVEMLAKHESAA